MPASLVIYTFSQGGREHSRLFERVLTALYSAVIDLDEQRAEPQMIAYGRRVLCNRAARERVWAACRADLLADRWQIPTALEAAGRQELMRRRG